MTTVLAPRRLAVRFEQTGIDLWQGASVGVEFVALRPVNLRITTDEWGDGTFLEWDGFHLENDPEPNERAIRDFVDLSRDGDESRIADFVRRWGLPSEDPDDAIELHRPRRAGGMAIGDWRDEARVVEKALLGLVATNDGDLLPVSDLITVSNHAGRHVRWPDEQQEWEEKRDGLFESLLRDARESGEQGRGSFEELRRQEDEHWLQWRDEERRRERGLEYQRHLLAAFVSYRVGSSYWSVSWDESGRRVHAEAVGSDGLVREHRRRISEAPELDVYRCSICSRLYEFWPDDGQRRPRRNARRYCGDECRSEGKRGSNRASWRRNGTRWRGQSQNSTHRRGSSAGPQKPESHTFQEA